MFAYTYSQSLLFDVTRIRFVPLMGAFTVQITKNQACNLNNMTERVRANFPKRNKY